jgi:CRP-like cAMP-binding protein
VLQHAGVPIEHIYFIEDGLVSVLASADERTAVEVGLIGREGAVGIVAILGVTVSPLRYFVQIGGSALRLKVTDLARVMQDIPELRATLHNALHAALMQSAQSAACNLSHTLPQRLARWLLAAQDRCHREDIPVTQDLFARNLGVRRASVSEVLKTFGGLFAKERGLIKILDRARLEEIACRCYRMGRERRDKPRCAGGRDRVYSLSALCALLKIELLAH